MDVEAYYNSITDKLVSDYLYGNPRTVQAIEYALRHISKPSQNVLDLGCGLGWTSFEFARHMPEVSVLGLDLSPKLIRCANSLFSLENLEYEVAAIQNLTSKANHYDTVIMIDVYEHVAPHHRLDLIQYLNESLTESGQIILTCPTRRHQEYLRKNFPDRLQPVDEIMEKADLEIMAKGIAGQIIEYKEVSIWDEKDYFHALISRKNKMFQGSINKYSAESPWHKYDRVLKAGLKIKSSKIKYLIRMLKQRWIN